MRLAGSWVCLICLSAWWARSQQGEGSSQPSPGQDLIGGRPRISPPCAPPPWPRYGLQSETGGCALNFGPRGSSVVTIPRERLQAGVEYTFNLTVWKAGRKEEVTNQTVGAALAQPWVELPAPRVGGTAGEAECTGPLPAHSTEYPFFFFF